MKTSSRLAWTQVGCLALVAGRPAPAADADPIAAAKLTKVGTTLVLPDETEVLDGVKALRLTKAAADKEVKARKVIDAKVAEKRKVITDSEKEYRDLETKLPLITKVDIHNRMITRMNRLFADHKLAMAAIKELDEQADKSSTTSKTKYIDELAALASKAGAVSARYTALAADAGVKAAVAKAPSGPGGAKVTLGPSAEFAAAAADLTKWASEVESETIPLRTRGGTRQVEVLLNGEKFGMILDTGASMITLPWDVAGKLEMTPTERDETIQLRLADGAVIEGKLMSLKSVRVGRFTVKDVTCVVLQKGLPDPPLLLGNSFLNQFIVKVDSGKNELHLTELSPGTASKPQPAAPAASAGGAKPPVKPVTPVK
ncbi:MAG: hypothetical protein JWO31_3443 [Phycisphaerales bacterium]|nr:hypothetical protein [Phycisphaerales bacterium]